MTIRAFLTFAALLPAVPAVAGPLPFETVRGTDFQSFVGNWDGDAPLCRAISSRAEWDAVIHPAASMNNRRPFAPAATFWRDRTLLLIARTGAPGPGGFGDTLQILGVRSQLGRIEVATSFAPAAQASYTAKFWAAAAVRRPISARTVVFTEGGRPLCTVQLTPAQQQGTRAPVRVRIRRR